MAFWIHFNISALGCCMYIKVHFMKLFTSFLCVNRLQHIISSRSFSKPPPYAVCKALRRGSISEAISTYICTYVSKYINTVRVYIYIYIYTSTLYTVNWEGVQYPKQLAPDTYLYMHMYIYVCIYCTYLYIYIYIHIYINIHIYMQKKKKLYTKICIYICCRHWTEKGFNIWNN
jgi:hypothetical protein